ncbi:MAG: ABC transporter ATP-binding protein [Spirochaetia bacterium]|nr:ABC transporter ATP-binding protein [Spirochaetia bacterium]
MKFSCVNLEHTVFNRTLFQKLSAVFPENSLTGIIGPNGSGKTTLLKYLAGITKPIKGNVYINNKDIHTFNNRERAKKNSYLPQNTFISYDLSVLEIVLLGRAAHQKYFSLWSDVDKKIARECLKAVQLDGFENREIKSLSGGEFQRVMLARMLAGQTENLLLDEAITALDIKHSLAFLELCKKLCENGKRIVLVIHQLELAYRYCDNILLLGLKNGKSLFGETKKIMTKKNLTLAFEVMTKHEKDILSFYSAK